jgi:Leucine-rich repeat (LRR) protein
MSRHPWLAVAVAASLATIGLPWFSPTPAHAASSFAATIPDDAYRRCVTTKLGLDAEAEPTEAELASITELSCTNKGITDVTGTSALPNLAKLFLGGNAISDLKPLSGASRVFSLGLENNQLTDIAPLAALTKLRAITLAGNKLRDLTALSVLPEYNAGSGTRYGQQATAADATVGTAAIVPAIVSASGTLVSPTPPEGVTISGNTVSYPSAGSYSWSFRDPDDFYFNGSVSVTVSASEATIPDAALRGCLNTRLSQAADVQPTPAQLSGLTGSLSCSSKGVRDLTGLNLATGLTGLNLSGNSISDVSPISALANLTSANLAMNEITSIVALGSLPKLGTIQLQQNLSSTKPKLISLAGVDKLTGLTAITANYTALRSLAPLAGHSSLKNLTATNNLLSDVTPLASVGGQLANVDLSGNQIANLSPLKDKSYTKLTATGQTLTAAPAKATVETDAPAVVTKDGSTLVATAPTGITASSGKVTYAEPGSYEWTFSSVDSLHGISFAGKLTQRVDEAPPVVVPAAVPDAGFRACLNGLLGQDASAELSVAQLAGLTTVSCTGKGIADLTGAENLTGATELVLSTNAISDLRPLAGLTGLKKLLLPGNAITDVSALATLTGLETLSLSYNPISSISGLAPLVNLTDLEVTQRSTHSGADLTSFDGVQTMTKLTRLVANNSSLTSLDPVAALTSLQRLYVSNNQLGDLSALAKLTELTHLGANTNGISDVGPLAGLTALTDLDLATNQILDLSPLKDLKNLGYLGLKARWQKVTASSVPAELSVATPRPRDNLGAVVDVAAPAGIQVHGGLVRYPEPGNYEWTFSAATAEGTYFSGTITQQVTEPVSGTAEIPDAGLRGCLVKAAGLPDNAVPTEADLAAVKSASCAQLGISDLTGAELLTSATSLELAGNPLGSLKPLEKLTALTSLDLSGTGLESVTSLAGLTGLTTLTLNDNALRDLSPLGGLGSVSVSATGQKLHLESVAGGAAVAVPTVTTVAGRQVAATVPSEATTTAGVISFGHAGIYQWPFATDGFTGSFTLHVTSDVPDPKAHAGASACVNAGRVWVVVERDTGRQQGGCATRFGTGLEALASAGFTPTGSGFVTAIDGYPSREIADSYWSYWQATDPVTKDGAVSYRWSYSQAGADQHRPKAGSIEGWRFESWKVDPAAPSWTPRITTSARTATRLSTTAVKAGYGSAITIPVAISPALASGKVTASIAKREFSATLSKGKAVLTVPAKVLSPGSYRVALSYAGNSSYAASTTTANVVVSKAKASLSVRLKGSSKRGRTTTFLVTVKSSAARPSGWVTVSLDGRTARAKLNAKGTATLKLTRTTKWGKRTARFSYQGNNLLSSAKATKRISVKR